MNNLNLIKKVMAILCIFTITFITLPIGSVVNALSGVYLQISAPSNYNPKVGESITFTLTYTGDVGYIGIGPGSVVLRGFTANKTITGSGNTRILTLSNIQGEGPNKYIEITGGTAISSTGDLSNKANSVTSGTFTIHPAAPVAPADTTAPKLTIEGPSASTVYNGESVTFTAKYTDNVGVANIWLNAGSIVLNGFTANKTITVSGNNRIITLTNIQGNAGLKSISITGGTAVDAAGNLSNAATSASFYLTQKTEEPKDTVAPVLKITGPNPASIYNGQSVTYTATYSDDKGIANIWLSEKSIVLNGFTANVRISGTGNTRTITLTNVQGSIGGSKNISITGGTAVDAAGNLSNAATSASFTILKEKEVPQDPKPQEPNDKPDDWVPNPNTGK
jgi:hypothetical protein